jgi:hypothetical protein
VVLPAHKFMHLTCHYQCLEIKKYMTWHRIQAKFCENWSICQKLERETNPYTEWIVVSWQNCERMSSICKLGRVGTTEMSHTFIYLVMETQIPGCYNSWEQHSLSCELCGSTHKLARWATVWNSYHSATRDKEEDIIGRFQEENKGGPHEKESNRSWMTDCKPL